MIVYVTFKITKFDVTGIKVDVLKAENLMGFQLKP